MGKSLAKAPFIAIFMTTLVYTAMNFLPFSPVYREAWVGAALSLSSFFMLLAAMLAVSVAIVPAITHMPKGALSIVFFLLTAVTLLWVLPALPMLWFGDTTKTATTADILLCVACLSAATILAFVLAALLISGAGNRASSAICKLKTPGLIMKLLLLPFLYLAIYMTSWHFLGWQHEAVRIFSGGTVEPEHFLQAIINLIFRDPTAVPFALFSGLLYILLMLPLMTRLAGRRSVFILSVLMLTLVSCVCRLIPVPWVPEELRIIFFVRDSSLSLLYSTISSVLLHFSYTKGASPVKAPAQAASRASSASRPPPPAPSLEARADRR